MVTEALIHRFDIETYHRLITDGILREDSEAGSGCFSKGLL